MSEKRVEWFFDDEDELKNLLNRISLVSEPATEDEFMLFNSNNKMLKFKTVDNERRVVTGAAMIPDLDIVRIDELTKELYYGFFSKKTVEKAAQLFFKSGINNSTNLEHIYDVDGVTYFESWIVTDPENDKSKALGFSNVKEGSWFVSAKIENDMVWENYIKTGLIRGFSVEIKSDERVVDEKFSKISSIMTSKLSDDDKYRLINKVMK